MICLTRRTGQALYLYDKRTNQKIKIQLLRSDCASIARIGIGCDRSINIYREELKKKMRKDKPKPQSVENY